MRFRFIFILLFAVAVASQASDSLTVKVKNNLSPITGFTGFIKQNPSAMFFTRFSDLTEFGADFQREKGNAALLQNGTARNEYKLHVHTLQHLQNNQMWGKVLYRKGHKDNVRWNESADFQLIYPYVINDTVGGDNLQMEEYSFSGGFARQLNRWNFGLQMDYRALKEYRTLDPRPDNTVSDLHFKGGISRNLMTGYSVGSAVYYRKYKQKNEIKFYSNLGAPWIYHDTGMGTNAYMFSGIDNEAMIDGIGYGVNMQLLPNNFFGFTSSIAYDYFSYEKQLSTKSYLPLSEINEDKFSMYISYTKKQRAHIYGIKLSASHRDRRGTEHLYNLTGSSSYEKISSNEMYGHKVNKVELSLLYGAENVNNFSWVILPSVILNSSRETYRNPLRKMNFSSISEGVHAHLSTYSAKVLLSADVSIHITQNISKKLLLKGLDSKSYASRILHKNYTYLSSNNIIYQARLRCDYPITKELALFVSTGVFYSSHNNGLDKYQIKISTGVVF